LLGLPNSQPVDRVLFYHRSRVSHGVPRPIDSRAAPTLGDRRVRSARVRFSGPFLFDPSFSFLLFITSNPRTLGRQSLSPRFFPRSCIDKFFFSYSRLKYLSEWDETFFVVFADNYFSKTRFSAYISNYLTFLLLNCIICIIYIL